MKEIVETLKKRISENKNSMLVTVVAGRGSIPRKAGAYMVVGENGRVTGTIGGGNLEYQATLMGQKLLAEKKNYLHEYNLGQEKSAELGMACGGNATVLFYFVDAREDAAWIRQMEEAEEKKEAFWILMPLEEGKIKILPEFQTFAHQSVTEIDGARFYAEQFSYDGKVYIFGGGHLAQELVPVLSHLGFRCIVSDDREEFTKPERRQRLARSLAGLSGSLIDESVRSQTDDLRQLRWCADGRKQCDHHRRETGSIYC